MHEILHLISLEVPWHKHSDDSLEVKQDSAIFDKVTVVFVALNGESRPSFSVAHLIEERVLYLKTGKKMCYNSGKAE